MHSFIDLQQNILIQIYKRQMKQSKLQPTKDHLKLIEELLTQNNAIKQKYQKIAKQNEMLRLKYKNLSKHCPQQIVNQVDQQFQSHDHKNMGTEFGHRQSRTQNQIIKQSRRQVQLNNQKMDQRINLVGNNISEISQHFLSEDKLTKKESVSSQSNGKKLQSLRSSRSSSRSSMNELFFPVIEGCFILEKKKCFSQQKGQKNHLSEMLQFVYPNELIKTQKQALQMMLKYTFTNPEIEKVQDDEFSSRRNQIVYGTPYQDYMYAFQDAKWIGRRQLPEILKLMGTMKKKYYHILVKSEIISRQQMQNESEKQNNEMKQENIKEGLIEEPKQIQKKQGEYFYETQVVYGFISPFPLRIFFQDLHRTIQQQLKYSQFIVDTSQQKVFTPEQNRKKKYEIIGKIMKKLYDQEYKINRFPIHTNYNTGIINIQLNIPSVIAYRQMQDEYLNQALQKYSSSKICKLLHFILAQKCILLGSSDKRSLNELFQIIRILIRPFLWIFAVVYVYSDYFQPFMSSPMPIIIGKIQQEEEEDNEKNKKQKKKILERQQSLQYSQFCHLRMDDEETELKQNEPYHKAIKKLKKQWDKLDKKDSKQKKEDKATFIHNYVHNLRVFIQKGVLNNEPTDFHIEFIDTQMVSYFKQPALDI